MNSHIENLASRAGMEDYPTYGVNALHGEKAIEDFARLMVIEVLGMKNDRYCDGDVLKHFGFMAEINNERN